MARKRRVRDDQGASAAERPGCEGEFDLSRFVIRGGKPLEGEIRVYHGAGMNECVVVSAGQGFVLDKGTRVQWEWPGPCKYVAICLPAFSPENAGREEATGPVAKTENALKKLRELHASSSSASSFQPGSIYIASYAAAVCIGATLGFLLCARAMR